MRVVSVDPVGELVRVALADDHRAGGAQPRNADRVGRGIAAPVVGAGGRRHVGHVDDVLHADRDAAQRQLVVGIGNSP